MTTVTSISFSCFFGAQFISCPLIPVRRCHAIGNGVIRNGRSSLRDSEVWSGTEMKDNLPNFTNVVTGLK